MATSALISAQEYLRTVYEPDAEFVEGRIEERSVGEREHSDLQRQLLILLSRAACQSYFVCNPGLRVQVSEERYRVPDLCLLSNDAPYEAVVRTAPLLCIEILSPEDTMRWTLVKVRDYLGMGVREVWVFDSESRTVQVCRPEGIVERSDGDLRIPATDCALNLAEAFSVLRRS